MTMFKHPRIAAAGLVLVLFAPSMARARTAVGSGPQMVGLFGPARASNTMAAGRTTDDYMVSLKRRGLCNGELAGPARAYSSHVITLNEQDPDSGTTCTVDITDEPDFTSIAVRESAACLTHHGSGCNFDGRFKRSR